MNTKKVLFVCIHNSARSQMAEEILRKFGGHRFEVESAGIEPGQLNPVVIDALKEEGIDITGKKTQSVADLLKAKKHYDYVITVCDNAKERCPFFPSNAIKLHYNFPDPAKAIGSDKEILNEFRNVRGMIKDYCNHFIHHNKI